MAIFYLYRENFHSFSFVLLFIVFLLVVSLHELVEGFGGVGLSEGKADQAEIFPRPDIRGRQTVDGLVVDLKGRFVELIQLN